jgi:hypothetical protein
MNENQKERGCEICKNPYFERNNYFYGKLMTTCDFFTEQCYFNEKRWLINRMTIGTGVVCGLQVVKIEGTNKKVKIEPGMCIDHCGREIMVCESQEVELEGEKPGKQQQTGSRPGRYFIYIEFRECKTEPIYVQPVCDEKEKCEFNRIRDSFIIKAIKDWEPEPGTPPFCPQSPEAKEKSMHKYLCRRLLRDFEDWPKSPKLTGLILAVVEVNAPGELVINNCAKEISDKTWERKLIYTNPMLYDLVHCFHGDLPRIVKFSWQHLHDRHIAWEQFKDLVESGLSVRFNQPMKPGSINNHTFLFAAIIKGAKAGYRTREYIAAEKIFAENRNTEFTFEVEKRWINDEIDEKGFSALREDRFGIDFEILLMANSIVGENGKALDGHFNGKDLPSGNGTQGGDFLSWFHLETLEGDQKQEQKHKEEREKKQEQKQKQEEEHKPRKK